MANEYGNYDIFKKIAEQEEEQTMIPEPPTGIELTDEVNRSEVDKLALIKKFMGMSDPASVEPTSTQGDPAAMTPPVEMPIAPPIVTPKPQIIPEAPIQDQLSARQQERKDIQDLLAKARQERSMTEGLAGITSGIKRAAAAYGGGGLTQIKADTGMEDQMIKSAGRDYKEAVADQKTKTENAKLDEAERRSAATAEVYRNILASSNGEEVDTSALEDPNAVYKAAQMKQMMDKKGKNGEMTEYQQARMDDFNERIEQKKLNRDLREREKLDRDVGKISTRLDKGGLIGRKRAIGEIEDFIMTKGWDLDDKKKEGDDISGMGLVGGFRPDFVTPQDDVDFRQNIQSLANQLLKARSGAAVTDQEYSRFLKETGSGNFSNEKNLMTGIRKMRDDIRSQMTNVVRSADPEAQVEFLKRTGLEDQLLDYEDKLNPKKSNKKTPHPQESEAMEWAKANPEDPRAIKIIQKLGQ